MIKVDCYMCGIELDEPGAILLSHPIENLMGVYKYHLCIVCEKFIMDLIDAKRYPKDVRRR